MHKVCPNTLHPISYTLMYKVLLPAIMLFMITFLHIWYKYNNLLKWSYKYEGDI